MIGTCLPILHERAAAEFEAVGDPSRWSPCPTKAHEDLWLAGNSEKRIQWGRDGAKAPPQQSAYARRARSSRKSGDRAKSSHASVGEFTPAKRGSGVCDHQRVAIGIGDAKLLRRTSVFGLET